MRPGVSFQVADALAPPFEANTFDVSRTETVLQHLANPRHSVTEMVRVTRPGGRVAALTFDVATQFLDHPDVELCNVLRDPNSVPSPSRQSAGKCRGCSSRLG